MTILNLLRADGSIVVNKALARNIGLHEAILYSELISKFFYFQERQQLTEDGYFFNTVENLEHDTCLSKYQQAKAIDKLTSLGLIQCSVRGLPARRYFKVVEDEQLILSFLSEKYLTSSSEETRQLEVKKLDSNNTKGIILNKKGAKAHKGADASHRAPAISFLEYERRYGQTDEATRQSILYYMKEYERNKGEKHPNYKPEQWEALTASFLLAGEVDMDADCMQEMIDQHFVTGYRPGCDYHIAHFNAGRVKELRAYETGCY